MEKETINGPFLCDGYVIKNEALVGYFGEDRGERFVLPPIASAVLSAATAGGFLVKEVTIPNGYVEIGVRCFEHYCSLKSIHIPDGLQKIGDLAFFDCPSLESLTLPESVIEVGKGFIAGCMNLLKFELPSGVKVISDIFKDSYTKEISITSDQFDYVIKKSVSHNKYQAIYTPFGYSHLENLIINGEAHNAAALNVRLSRFGLNQNELVAITSAFICSPLGRALKHS